MKALVFDESLLFGLDATEVATAPPLQLAQPRPLLIQGSYGIILVPM